MIAAARSIRPGGFSCYQVREVTGDIIGAGYAFVKFGLVGSGYRPPVWPEATRSPFYSRCLIIQSGHTVVGDPYLFPHSNFARYFPASSRDSIWQ